MTKKKKATIISLSVIGGVLLTAGVLAFIIFVGFWFLWPTTPRVRQLIYNEYADDSKYITITGTATVSVWGDDGYAYINITPDEEFLQSHTNYTPGVLPYEIDSVNGEYLRTTNFHEILTDFETEKYGYKIYTLPDTVTLTVNNSIWWDGDKPNLISIEVDGTTYLDYETGKANLLYYVQNVMY